MLTILPYSAAGLPGFVFDSAEPPKLTRNLTVCKHPLEKGAKTADHLIKQVPEISVEGYISLSPVKPEVFDGRLLGAGTPLRFPSGLDLAKEADTLLSDYQTNAALLTVVTGQGTFDNMALISVENVRDGGGSRFALKFEQIVLNAISTGQAPKPKQPKAAPKVNAGAKNGTPGGQQPTSQELKSWLWSATKGQ